MSIKPIFLVQITDLETYGHQHYSLRYTECIYNL